MHRNTFSNVVGNIADLQSRLLQTCEPNNIALHVARNLLFHVKYNKTLFALPSVNYAAGEHDRCLPISPTMLALDGFGKILSSEIHEATVTINKVI